ncbi:MAG: hypothetical protein ABIJ03_03725 [Patescibacteria group bacterium]
MTDPTTPINSYVNDYQPPKDDDLAPDEPQSPILPPAPQSSIDEDDLITEPPQMPVVPPDPQPPVADDLISKPPQMPIATPVTPDVTLPVTPSMDSPIDPPVTSTMDSPVTLSMTPPATFPEPNIDPMPKTSQSSLTPNEDPMPATPALFPQVTEASEKLADQNIFFLLGVKEDEATAEQRESFLDELQQVIWEDFLENDVQLLLTKQESDELKQMTDKTQGKAIEDQEEIVVFLEKLIPDLEEIMLEKALELKADMVKERIAGMKERLASDPEKLKQVESAEQQLTSNLWLSLAKTLNAIQ